MNEAYNKLKFFEEREEIKSEIYYHYTSLGALYEIVCSHTFRLMSLKSSNDRSELYYSFQDFEDDLKRIVNNLAESAEKEYCAIVMRGYVKHQKEISEELRKKPLPYSLCLAKKRDNLTHWDRYADHCRGVCIAFNVAALEVYYRRMSLSVFGRSYFTVDSALYTQEDIDVEIRKAFSQSCQELENICNKYGNSLTAEFVEDRAYLFLLAAYYSIRNFAKKSCFVDEDEVRLYHDANSYKDTLRLLDSLKGDIEEELYQNIRKHFMEIGQQMDIFKERFAWTGSGIRSYRNLCLNEIWGSGVIPEIIIGPQCVQNRRELERFLKQNGLQGTKISVSKVPIR